MKNLKYYLGLDYPVTITKGSDRSKRIYVAEIPDLPGCRVQGNSYNDALRNLKTSKELWIKISLKKGLAIPEPISEDEFSGRVLLRIPAKLHMAITRRAKAEGLSLNQYIRNRLEASETSEKIQKELRELKENIIKLSTRGFVDTMSHGSTELREPRKEIEPVPSSDTTWN